MASVYQELVTNYISEGALRRRPLFSSDTSLSERLESLRAQFVHSASDDGLLRRANEAAKERLDRNEAAYYDMVCNIITATEVVS